MSECKYMVGDKVMFGRPNGEQTQGTVVKVNPKKLKVRQDEVRGSTRMRPAGTIWTVPPSLCRKIGMGAPVGTPLVAMPTTAKRPDAEIMRDILDAYCSLSPENLSCDGECSRSEVNRRAASLRADLRRLFAEIGREVTESEAYGDKPYAGESTPVSRRTTYAPAQASGYKVGDKVTFDARGTTVVGYVKSANVKTVSVLPVDEKDPSRWWRVSPRLLKAV